MDLHRLRSTATKGRLAASLAFPHAAGDFAEHGDEPVDRDHEHTVLVALHSSRSYHAQDGKRPATAPPAPATTEPPSLLDDPAQLALVIRTGLGLDRESKPVGATATESISPRPDQRSA
jgi:hypothetical protein